jgi:hypothetical protein
MNTMDILSLIKKNLQKKKAEIAETMIDGRMSDFQSYQKNVGIAQGIDVSCSVIDETIKQINIGDE